MPVVIWIAKFAATLAVAVVVDGLIKKSVNLVVNNRRKALKTA